MTSLLSRQHDKFTRSPSILFAGLGIGVGILVLCLFASIGLGAADITPGEVWDALFTFDESSTNHLIIRTVRLPRSIIALLVGAAMAIAGAIMQGLTSNPLASPSILGVSTGAAFAVVLSTFIFGVSSLSVYAWFALAGGAVTAGLVYLFASLGPGGVTPLNLTLAGTVFSTLISTLTSGILILNQQTLEQVRFWLAGSLSGGDIDLVRQVIPYLIVGFFLALALGRHVTTLSLGETVAKGLGQNTAWIKVLGAISVVLLVGGSVSIAGPIGFVGLIVPHFVRFLVGVDYRWILPYAAILGAVILLIADICARLILRPIELPVGLVMPLLGAPFFIYLIRTRIRR
ncbi:MAG: iron ABC transporter permease [Merismopedia sp. SIO2A8]|nr:iron ABC transporter permease [Symploca sp. SIO2B6]NET48493.1 iron ABC transporter permease [Merismopedia sp. SIO2A8]